MKRLISNLLRENTGYSTRSALLVWGMCFATLLTVHFVAIDWVAMFLRINNPVNYYGWGIVLGGIATVVLAVVYGKAMKDKYLQRYEKDNNTIDGSGGA